MPGCHESWPGWRAQALGTATAHVPDKCQRPQAARRSCQGNSAASKSSDTDGADLTQVREGELCDPKKALPQSLVPVCWWTSF